MLPSKVSRGRLRSPHPTASLLPAAFGFILIAAVVLFRGIGSGASSTAAPTGSADATAAADPTDKLAAYESAHPHGTWGPMLSGMDLGMTAEPLLPEPDWAKTIVMVPREDRRDGPLQLRDADSVWQVGSVPEDGARLWDDFYVWTALDDSTDPATSELGTFVLNATDPDTLALDVVYPCPQAIGHLTIVAATEDSVNFTSDAGVSGTFNLGTHAWTFDLASPQPTAAP
jgi:hypothetical protein